jgi:hypothetical protein
MRCRLPKADDDEMSTDNAGKDLASSWLRCRDKEEAKANSAAG